MSSDLIGNIQNHKVKKYSYKYGNNNNTKYLKKLICHLANPIMIGGNGNNNPVILDNNDLDSVLNYLKSKASTSTKKTNKKYFVILFGPPASGKSNARHKACEYIKEYFEKDIQLDDIKRSFIDSGLDEIVYDTKYPDTSGKTTSEMLKNASNEIMDNFKKTVTSHDQKEQLPNMDIDIVKKNIKEFVTKSSQIYFTSRIKTNASEMSVLLMYFAMYLNKNIYFETASYNKEYMSHIFDIINYAKYIPIVIYPFVRYSGVLYNRSINRGIKEGRYLLCDDSENKSNHHTLIKNM